MADSIKKKELMAGYTGVKFQTIQLNESLPSGFDKLFPLFKECADLAKEHGMVPQNAGNFSMRFAGGMAITTSGANLEMLEEDEVVFLKSCSMEDMKVEYIGANKPSSESLLHYSILQCRPDADAVVHVHNIPPSEVLAGVVKETPREEAYGSAELAAATCETLGKDEKLIVMKNHGYVAVGPTLMDAAKIILDAHLKLKAKQGKS